MITIKKEHNLKDERLIKLIDKFNNVIRYSYNRIIKDNITKPSDLEKLVKLNMKNIDCLDSSWIKCAVGGFHYDCYINQLKDVYGFPDYFEGQSWFKGNPVEEIVYVIYLHKHEKRKYIRFLNEYLAIRNGNIVIESRLRDALAEVDIIGIDIPEFKNYKII